MALLAILARHPELPAVDSDADLSHFPMSSVTLESLLSRYPALARRTPTRRE
jgi:hypothetical protein